MKISKIRYQIQEDDRREIEKSVGFHMLQWLVRPDKIAGQMLDNAGKGLLEHNTKT